MKAPPLSACGQLVRRGDPQRFASALTAPAGPRERLFALYAFNLELARIPTASSEPITGLIRLQWWRDALDEVFAGDAPRAHEVVEPLAAAIRETDLPQHLFTRILDARAADAARDWPRGGDPLDAYLRDTGGALLALAARALHPGGADEAAEQAGYAFAARRWIAAQPALTRLGAAPLDAAERERLQKNANNALHFSRQVRIPPPARPAFREGWRNRAGLLAQALRGRW